MYWHLTGWTHPLLHFIYFYLTVNCVIAFLYALSNRKNSWEVLGVCLINLFNFLSFSCSLLFMDLFSTIKPMLILNKMKFPNCDFFNGVLHSPQPVKDWIIPILGRWLCPCSPNKHPVGYFFKLYLWSTNIQNKMVTIFCESTWLKILFILFYF